LVERLNGIEEVRGSNPLGSRETPGGAPPRIAFIEHLELNLVEILAIPVDHLNL
jgi:hypothetical protein